MRSATRPVLTILAEHTGVRITQPLLWQTGKALMLLLNTSFNVDGIPVTLVCPQGWPETLYARDVQECVAGNSGRTSTRSGRLFRP